MLKWIVQRSDNVTDTTGVTCTVASPLGLFPARGRQCPTESSPFDFSRRNL